MKKKINILYLSNSLDERGPTNQLYNIIFHLCRKKYNVYLIILTNKENDKEIQRFKKLGITILPLGKNLKWYNIFLAFNYLEKIFYEIDPQIIHTHGLIPDLISFIFRKKYKCIITSRNIPHDDYPGKYGYLFGNIMGYIHLFIFKKSPNVVSCSKSMQRELIKNDIDSLIIKNGVKTSHNKRHIKQLIKYQKPIFLFVGSIIKRKNIDTLVQIMDKYISQYNGSLLIIGGGPLFDNYSFKNTNKNIHFLGHQANTKNYFLVSDYYISLSLSEGLPNSVLESLSFGKPVILSNIKSHVEIKNDFSEMVTILKGKKKDKIIEEIDRVTKKKFMKNLNKNNLHILSSERMSNEYQKLYSIILNR